MCLHKFRLLNCWMSMFYSVPVLYTFRYNKYYFYVLYFHKTLTNCCLLSTNQEICILVGEDTDSKHQQIYI